MRSYKDPAEFFNRMKKKPALQNILDNLDKFTEADLQNVDQPLWIRDQLIKRKKGLIDIRSEQEKRDVAENIADEMMKKSCFSLNSKNN